MKTKTICAFSILIFFLATDSFAASTGIRRLRSPRGGNNDSYKAGEGDSVKKVKAEDYQKTSESEKPLCIYIFDSDTSNNTKAKLLEGSDGLGSAEVRDKLKGFSFQKMKADGSDAKGWPVEWMQRAKNAAAIIIASGDRRQILIFDKETPREQITPNAISNALDSIMRYQESQKKAQEEAKKKTK